MKKTIKLLFRFLSQLWGGFFSYSILKKWQLFKIRLYSFWIAKEFKSIGDLSTICYPLDLLGGKYISLGDEVLIGTRGILTAWDSYQSEVFSPNISIGNKTVIGEDCHITAINNITIGENVLIGKKVTITDNDHGKTDIENLALPPVKRKPYSKGPVAIGDNVWIGDKATILGNVTIGANAIIGANSLVTKDVPENCVVGGIPAKIIKTIS